jgi:transposase
LRGWSYDKNTQVSRADPEGGRPAGAGTPRRVRLGVGSDHVGCQQVRGGSAEKVHSWLRRADVDEGVVVGVSSDERQRIKDLQRENRELRRANEILKAASVFFAAELDPRPKS